MNAQSTQAEKNLIQALEQYEKLIFSICYRMTQNYFDSQDLTQETFLSYYQSQEKFDGQNLKAYLSQIATNKCLDYLKKAERRISPAEDTVLEYHTSAVPATEETVMDQMVHDELYELCRSLKPPYDQVAQEYYCNGKTAAEIAKCQNRKLKTIQTQIGRAKKMLQKQYRKENPL